MTLTTTSLVNNTDGSELKAMAAGEVVHPPSGWQVRVPPFFSASSTDLGSLTGRRPLTAQDDNNNNDPSTLLEQPQASSTTSTPGLAQWPTPSVDDDMGLQRRCERTGHVIRRVLDVRDIVPVFTAVNRG